MTETFEQIQLRLLRASYERLGVFLNHGPENIGPVVTREIALMVRRAAGVYGLDVFAEIGRSMVDNERKRLGFCITCSGSPKPISDEKTPHGGDYGIYGMCVDCLASAREDEPEEEAASV